MDALIEITTRKPTSLSATAVIFPDRLLLRSRARDARLALCVVGLDTEKGRCFLYALEADQLPSRPIGEEGACKLIV